jgi:hypothetical protein
MTLVNTCGGWSFMEQIASYSCNSPSSVNVPSQSEVQSLINASLSSVSGGLTQSQVNTLIQQALAAYVPPTSGGSTIVPAGSQSFVCLQTSGTTCNQWAVQLDGPTAWENIGVTTADVSLAIGWGFGLVFLAGSMGVLGGWVIDVMRRFFHAD